MALYRQPATLAVAQAIGSPSMNLLPATIVAADDAGAEVELSGGRRCRVGAQVPAGDVGRTATLGIRPEHLVPDAAGVFGGKVELFERLGPLSFVHLGEPGAAAVVAQLPGDRHVGLGETVRFAVAAGDAQLFAEDGTAYGRVAS